MANTVTLHLSDDQYALVKRYAEEDRRSINAWIESLVDVEDMRRRCAAHGQYMSDNPEAVRFAEVWAEQNLEALPMLASGFPSATTHGPHRDSSRI